MSRRVLLTGATGLIGRAALKALKKRGFQVVALSRSGPVSGADATVVGDILDVGSRADAVKNADADDLLHLAWHDDPTNRWQASENALWAGATLDLVAEFAAAGGRRALCVGSCAEYDWSASPLGEDTPLNPKSAYARAKAETGRRLLERAGTMGLSAVWARVFFCFGPGEPEGRLLGDLLAGLSQGREVPCTDGEQERDFLHVADVGRALATVLASDLTGAVNIASGQATKVRELIETVARLMGRPDLIRLGALSRPERDAPRVVADVARLGATGFRPRLDIESGLLDCVQTYLGQQK